MPPETDRLQLQELQAIMSKTKLTLFGQSLDMIPGYNIDIDVRRIIKDAGEEFSDSEKQSPAPIKQSPRQLDAPHTSKDNRKVMKYFEDYFKFSRFASFADLTLSTTEQPLSLEENALGRMVMLGAMIESERVVNEFLNATKDIQDSNFKKFATDYDLLRFVFSQPIHMRLGELNISEYVADHAITTSSFVDLYELPLLAYLARRRQNYAAIASKHQESAPASLKAFVSGAVLATQGILLLNGINTRQVQQNLERLSDPAKNSLAVFLKSAKLAQARHNDFYSCLSSPDHKNFVELAERLSFYFNTEPDAIDLALYCAGVNSADRVIELYRFSIDQSKSSRNFYLLLAEALDAYSQGQFYKGKLFSASSINLLDEVLGDGREKTLEPPTLNELGKLSQQLASIKRIDSIPLTLDITDSISMFPAQASIQPKQDNPGIMDIIFEFSEETEFERLSIHVNSKNDTIEWNCLAHVAEYDDLIKRILYVTALTLQNKLNELKTQQSTKRAAERTKTGTIEKMPKKQLSEIRKIKEVEPTQQIRQKVVTTRRTPIQELLDQPVEVEVGNRRTGAKIIIDDESRAIIASIPQGERILKQLEEKNKRGLIYIEKFENLTGSRLRLGDFRLFVEPSGISENGEQLWRVVKVRSRKESYARRRNRK